MPSASTQVLTRVCASVNTHIHTHIQISKCKTTTTTTTKPQNRTKLCYSWKALSAFTTVHTLIPIHKSVGTMTSQKSRTRFSPRTVTSVTQVLLLTAGRMLWSPPKWKKKDKRSRKQASRSHHSCKLLASALSFVTL